MRHGKQQIRSRPSYSNILSITRYILNLTHPTPPIGWLFKLPVLHNEALCPVVHAHASHQEIVHNKNSTAAFIWWKWAATILSLCLRPFFFTFCHSAMCRPSGPDDEDLQWHRCRHTSAGGGERACFWFCNSCNPKWNLSGVSSVEIKCFAFSVPVKNHVFFSTLHISSWSLCFSFGWS